MSIQDDHPVSDAARVSLRELNQHSGRVVARVNRTRRPVIITDRGRPVARIEPFDEELTPLDRMIAEGIVEPAREQIGPDMPVLRLPDGVTSRQLLEEDREEISLPADAAARRSPSNGAAAGGR